MRPRLAGRAGNSCNPGCLLHNGGRLWRKDADPMKKASISIIFLTVLIDLVGFGLILPLIPIYSENFHASGFMIGAIMGSYSLMQFLFAPVWGRISDRVGRRPGLLGS